MKTVIISRQEYRQRLVRLVAISMLAAIAVVLVLLIRVPFVPPLTILEYDLADVPILIGAMLYGPLPGLAILLVVCVIQAFALGGNALAGFLMHFVASTVMVLIVSLFHRKSGGKWKWTLIGMGLGMVAETLVMIPMNLIVTVNMYGAPFDFVVANMPLIILFNITKTAIHCTVTALLFAALRPFIKKNPRMLGLQ